MQNQNTTPQRQTPPDFAPIEARLMAILGGGNAQQGNALGNIVAIMDRHALAPVLRVKLLLFTATGAAACLTGRLTLERTGELFRVEMQNAMQDHADGRMIERHRLLMLTLIRRGCERRGEIPAVGGEEKANANA